MPLSPWLLAAALIPSLFGMSSAQAAQGQANALTERQVGLQEELQDYLLGRRRRIFDPMEEEALGRAASRMRSSPWYAATWLGQARGLRRPMALPAPR